MSYTNEQSTPVKSWKDFYIAALLEGDKNRVPVLIAKAESAIVKRARELFDDSGDNIQERDALDDALYALHALKTCMSDHGKFADAA